MNIIFLDIDGVLNCQIFYTSNKFKDYKEAKKQLRKDVKAERIERLEFYSNQICKERIKWLNDLCTDINAVVVVSSTWRNNKTVDELQEIFNYCGATFKVIDKTPNLRHEGCIRGNEIYNWIDNNREIVGCYVSEYKTYAIIDDDSDMLLWQKDNFFQTDSYSGLTPNTCYKIKRFFAQFNVTK